MSILSNSLSLWLCHLNYIFPFKIPSILQISCEIPSLPVSSSPGSWILIFDPLNFYSCAVLFIFVILLLTNTLTLHTKIVKFSVTCLNSSIYLTTSLIFSFIHIHPRYLESDTFSDLCHPTSNTCSFVLFCHP